MSEEESLSPPIPPGDTPHRSITKPDPFYPHTQCKVHGEAHGQMTSHPKPFFRGAQKVAGGVGRRARVAAYPLRNHLRNHLADELPANGRRKSNLSEKQEERYIQDSQEACETVITGF